MKLFELFATLGLDTSGFDKGVKGAQGKMTSLASTAGKAVEGVGKGALSIGKAAANAAGSIIDTMENALKTIGTIGGGAMIALGTQAVSAAADIAAENAAFSATFGEMADEAKSAYAIIGEQANILDTRLQKTATKGFSQLKGAGMSANEALEASTRLLNLAADGAAYYDQSLEDTDERLRSFLRGNVEAGDSIGLFTSELQRNNKAVDLYGKKWDKLTESQRQMVMLNIAEEIYKQSGVIGQAARESEGWANVIGNLKEAWRQTLGVIGTPIMDSLTPVIKGITTYLVDHKDDLQGFAEDLGNVVSLLTTGHEAEAIQAASGMITSFIDAINRELKSGELEKKGQEIFDSLQLAFTRGIDELSETVKLIGPEILAGIVTIKADLLVAGIELIGALAEGIANDQTDFTKTVSTVVQKVSDAVKTNAPKMVEGAGALLLALAGGLTSPEGTENIKETVKNIVDAIGDWVGSEGNVSSLTESFGTALQTAVSAAFESLLDPIFLENLLYGIASVFGTGLDALTFGIFGFQEMTDKNFQKAIEGLEYHKYRQQFEENRGNVDTSTLVWEYEGATKAAEEYASAAEAAGKATQEVSSAQESLGEAVKNASTTFENAEETFGGAAGSFGKAAQAAETLQGAIEGVEASEAQLEEQVNETTQAIQNMFPNADITPLKGRIGDLRASIEGLRSSAISASSAISSIFNTGPKSTVIATHAATGLERVPYDGFPVVLHKDEMVLDRKDANAYRNGDAPGPSKGGVTVNQYIQSVPQTASELAFQTMNALEMLRFNA